MKPKTSTKKLLIAAAGLLLAPMVSQAATISQFLFTSDSSASEDTELTTTTSVITFGAGITGAAFANNRLEIGGDDTTAFGPGTFDAALGFAITNNQYSTFTVTIPSSHIVDLTQLTFTYGTFDAFEFAMGLFTDKTGFTSGAARLDGVYDNVADDSSFPRDINLSGITALQGLTNTTVEFRFYTGDRSGLATRQHRFDDIVLNGNLTVIPEPSTALLGGLGLLALLRRRR